MIWTLQKCAKQRQTLQESPSETRKQLEINNSPIFRLAVFLYLPAFVQNHLQRGSWSG